MQNQYNMWDIYIWRDYMQKNVYMERYHAKNVYIGRERQHAKSI